MTTGVAQSELYAFIASHKLAVLSTVKAAHSPQSALIGIAVTPQLEIIFDTLKSSRKYANLVANPSCSLVIGWSSERTLQYEGTARELRGSDLAAYQKVYFEAWPECIPHQSWPDITYFVVKAAWLRYSDYNQSPPLIFETTYS